MNVRKVPCIKKMITFLGIFLIPLLICASSFTDSQSQSFTAYSSCSLLSSHMMHVLQMSAWSLNTFINVLASNYTIEFINTSTSTCLSILTGQKIGNNHLGLNRRWTHLNPRSKITYSKSMPSILNRLIRCRRKMCPPGKCVRRTHFTRKFCPWDIFS